MSTRPITYASAGVDVDAGDAAVALMKESVRAASRPEVIGGLGGFAGLFDASALRGMRRPVLATATDGVGTKVAIAQALDLHDTIGFDLVGMVVDDIVVCGAEPLFMTDYIATGRVVPERIAAIVAGIARACQAAGVALVGGETAEHPGLLEPHEYDLAGAATGVVEHEDILGPHLVQPGDALVALGSSGLHANGFSLVRAVIQQAGWPLEREVAELGRSLGAELLTPTRVYAAVLLRMLRRSLDIHALSHITGGGLAANVARVLPEGTLATLERGTWRLPPVMTLIQQLGQVPDEDLERTLNLGIGFVMVLSADRADDAVRSAEAEDIPAWVLGTVDAVPTHARGLQARQDDQIITGSKGVKGERHGW